MLVSPEAQVAKWCETIQTANNFERWMGDLPDCLKHIPIIHLAIPGTHDSMSCGISRSSGIAPDSTTIVKVLGKFFGPVVKPIVFKWCVTQRILAEDQLLAGIRYFDLRIAVHKATKTLQFVHGMYAEEIQTPFSHIKDFLLSHQQEVVVLDIQHFYDFSDADHKQLQDFLHNYFGSMMCPLPENGDVSSITLNWMIKQGHQIILIYRNQAGIGDPQLWPSGSWPTPWPQTTSVQNMMSFIMKGLSQRPPNAGYVTQCVLTPDPWFVVRHPLSNLLSRCAMPCNYAVISWLEEQHPGHMGVNVVITDYFDFDPAKFPFVKTIVFLNRKLVQNTHGIIRKIEREDDKSIYNDAHSHI